MDDFQCLNCRLDILAVHFHRLGDASSTDAIPVGIGIWLFSVKVQDVGGASEDVAHFGVEHLKRSHHRHSGAAMVRIPVNRPTPAAGRR